jgi:hypothetical protein
MLTNWSNRELDLVARYRERIREVEEESLRGKIMER